MDTKTNVIACNVCGHRMAIPAGFEGRACRCSKCNTPLQTGEDALTLKLDFDLGSPPPPKPAANQSKSAAPPTAAELKVAALKAVLSGLVGMVAGALILGSLMAILAVATAPPAADHAATLHIAFKGGADFGVLAGFLLGSILCIMYSRDLSYAVGMAIGASIGLGATLLHYAFETVFLAQADTSAATNGVIGLFGGAVLAAMILWYKKYREEE